MSKKLQNKTLIELKDLCRDLKIKGYSKLNKDEIIKLLKRKNKKGGSIDDPIINVYIYKVLDTEAIDNFNINKARTKQKFSKFYPTKNEELGIIYPNSYINNRVSLEIEKKFNRNSFINDEKYYSNDPLTSVQSGGTDTNMKNYYNFYLSKLTKVKNFQNSGIKFYNNQREMDVILTISKATKKLKDYIVSKNNTEKNISLKIEGAYIFNINIAQDEKIIIVGDLHGSYHSFIRIFTRLHILGVIDFNNFIINEGYILIFLGDIADRGQYAVEIYYILSKFIIANNSNEKLKIILNRGNHEDPKQWERETYSFTKELISKFDKHYIFYEKMIDFLGNCPSAIVLNYSGRKYWLCHGGFPIGINETSITFKIPNESVCFYPRDINNIPFQIRWCDFYNDPSTNHTGTGNLGRPQIGLDKLKRFLYHNKINFIIRGHNDNYDNTFILSENSNPRNSGLPQFVLGLNSENLQSLNAPKKNIMNTSAKIIYPEIIYENQYVQQLKQTDGPVCRIKTNNWTILKSMNIISNVSLLTNNNSKLTETIYPVLTISTNSDLLRTLNNDSFIVLNFSDGEDFNKIHPENIKRFFTTINNKFNENNKENSTIHTDIPGSVPGNNLIPTWVNVPNNNNLYPNTWRTARP